MSPKLSELKSAKEIHKKELRDPEIRAEHERLGVAHAVAMRIIQYRTEHGLTQSALARQLGMQQPAIARLEAGDHEPSLATLARLAQGLGITFHVDITPDAVDLRAIA